MTIQIQQSIMEFGEVKKELPPAGKVPKVPPVVVDPQKIEGELQELAGNIKVKVRLDKHLALACSTRETDDIITIRFNPKNIRSVKRLEELLNKCRDTAVGPGVIK